MKIYKYITAVAGCILLLFPLLTSAQQAASVNRLETIITDADGTPISGATIYANEGVLVEKSDENGRFSFNATLIGNILVEAPGYESGVLSQLITDLQKL